MILALTRARPDELPAVLAYIIANPYSPTFNIANYLDKKGGVQMLVDGVLHSVPLPPAPPVSPAPAVPAVS